MYCLVYWASPKTNVKDEDPIFYTYRSAILFDSLDGCVFEEIEKQKERGNFYEIYELNVDNKLSTNLTRENRKRLAKWCD